MKMQRAKQLLVLLFSAALVLTMMPCDVYAYTAGADGDVAKETVSEEDGADDASAEESADEEAAEETSANETAAAEDASIEDTDPYQQDQPDSADAAAEPVMNAAEVNETGTVSYIDENGKVQTKALTDCHGLPSGEENVLTIGKNGETRWYYLAGDLTVNQRITIVGKTHVILADGAHLNAESGIRTPFNDYPNAELHIYAQSTGDGMGQITADVSSGSEAAGIGGNGNEKSALIEINGGKIVAKGGKYAAGIGGGDNAVAGNVIINGGYVEATGGDYGAGIGSGDESENGGYVTINGGTVKAYGGCNAAGIGGGNEVNGGTITINGGDITAEGDDNGAGIGGGDYGGGGTIVITGGTVSAKGGDKGAGIGGGRYGEGDSISISGGDNIKAEAGFDAAGIGGGYKGYSGLIRISGGGVIAQGRAGAGIGSGPYSSRRSGSAYEQFGKIYISGGNIQSKSGGSLSYEGGAGIGSGREGDPLRLIEITGGIVNAFGGGTSDGDPGAAGIGGGYESRVDNITITGGDITAYRGGGNAKAIGHGPEASDFEDCTNLHIDYEYGVSSVDSSTFFKYNYRVPKDYYGTGDINANHVSALSTLDISGNFGYVKIAPCSHDIDWTTDGDTHTGECEYCGYTESGAHDYSTIYHDATTHWAECKDCGALQSRKQAHTIGGDGKTCAVCGQELSTVTLSNSGAESKVVYIATGEIYTTPACPEDFKDPEDTGRDFLGWKQGESSNIYIPGDKFKISEDITLTAIWGETWASLQKQINKAAAGATITLGSDYLADSECTHLVIGSGKKVTIDLNGHTIDRNGASGGTSTGDVIWIDGGDLTITDSSENGSGLITGGKTYSSKMAAGININGGSLTLKGGTVSGNLGMDGGIFVGGGGALHLNGGSVKDNVATLGAGGVNVSDGTISVEGSSSVTGNTSVFGTIDSNVNFFDEDQRINVTGALDPEAHIGIYTSVSIADGKLLEVTGDIANYATLSNFSADNKNYATGLRKIGSDVESSSYKVVLGTPVVVTLDDGYEGTGSTDSITFNVAKNSTIFAPSCTFEPVGTEVFIGWYIEDASEEDFDENKIIYAMSPLLIEGDTTLTAVWGDRQGGRYYVNISAGTGGKAYASPTSGKKGDAISLYAFPDIGCTFVKWDVKWDTDSESDQGKIDDPAKSSATLTLGDSDVTVEAVFEKEEKPAETTVSLDEDSITLKKDETVQLTATLDPEDASDTISWNSTDETVAVVDDNGKVSAVTAGETEIVALLGNGNNAACTVTVEGTHSIILTQPENGSVTASSYEAYKDDTVTLTAYPDDGYRFVEYTASAGIDASDISGDAFTMPDEDVTVSAVFEKIPEYTVTFDANGGSGTMNKQTVREGESFALPGCTFDPPEGKVFDVWQVGEGSVLKDPGDKVDITAATTIYAVWKTTPTGEQAVYVNPSPDTAGTAYADVSSAADGTNVTLTAAPRSGYEFSEWSVQSGDVTVDNANSATTTFTMGSSEVSVRAIFTKKPIEKVKLSPNEISLKKDNSGTIAAEVQPSDVVVTGVKWSSSDTSVVRVDRLSNRMTAMVTGLKAGTAVITFNADGVERSCTVTVTDEEAEKALAEAKVSANSYFNSVNLNSYQEPEKTAVKNALAKGRKAVSSATTEAAVSSALAAAKKTINAQAVYNSKLPKVTNKKAKKAKKALTAKWKKLSKKNRKKITGFQVQVATDKKFTKNTKIVKVKGKAKVSKKIKKLKAKKKYYIRVRTYKVKSGKTYVSKWSKVKTIRTK